MKGIMLKLKLTFLLCTSVLPCFALAEGAIRVLECRHIKNCDASATCKPAEADTVFQMEPKTLADDGSGRFIIHYNGQQSDMTALSYVGPFFWTAASGMNTLLASSETRFLWHTLTLDPVPNATFRILECQFTQ